MKSNMQTPTQTVPTQHRMSQLWAAQLIYWNLKMAVHLPQGFCVKLALHLQRNTNRTRTEDLKHATPSLTCCKVRAHKKRLHLSSCSITVFKLCWTCNDICAQGLTTAVLMAQRANPMHSIPYNPNVSNQKHPISPPTHTYTALSVSEFKLAINSCMLCFMNNTKYPWCRAWWNPALCIVL